KGIAAATLCAASSGIGCFRRAKLADCAHAKAFSLNLSLSPRGRGSVVSVWSFDGRSGNVLAKTSSVLQPCGEGQTSNRVSGASGKQSIECRVQCEPRRPPN